MRIDIAGRVMESACEEHALILRISDGVTIRIETLFELSEPDRPAVAIDPDGCDGDVERWESILHGRTVDRAEVDVNEGKLSMGFDGGVTVDVPPDPDYEAWAVTRTDGVTIVSLPGGGVSRWGARE